ncbi:MAG: cupredoxin domain-containing protein [Patescibacteria group bacterium]
MKGTITSILVALVLIGGAFIFSKGNFKTINENVASVNNVTLENGVQIVEIKARGGYTPRKSVAKAGIPTILRFNTEGTFDCSSSVRIPSLNISKNLPLSGVTDIELGNSSLGVLQGTCSMGMYPFEVDFQS